MIAKGKWAAPVPPSPPSMVIISGLAFLDFIRSASSDQNPIWPTADLIPTGNRFGRQCFDDINEFIDALKSSVTVWRKAVLSHRNTTNLGNFRRDLGAR